MSTFIADEDGSKSTSKTLHEAAAEYTESHSNKRKYEVVDVVTGEEEESNVLQANVKLYIFESEKKNWVERGRGTLRLNDDPSSTPGHLRSRLVMRTVGTLRIVLNTKLFPNMKCEKVSGSRSLYYYFISLILPRLTRRTFVSLHLKKMKSKFSSFPLPRKTPRRSTKPWSTGWWLELLATVELDHRLPIFRINQLNSDQKEEGDEDQEPPEKKAAKSEEA